MFTLVLQALRWNLCPETAVSWLNLYLQMASMNSNSDLLEPQFPQDAYVQMTRVGFWMGISLCASQLTLLSVMYHRLMLPISSS